jgi:L-lactate utilization protein LutB
MDNPLDQYWRFRLDSVKKALEENNFTVFVTDNARQAGELVIDKVITANNAKVLSWGGSMTFRATGLYEVLCNDSRFEIIDTYDRAASREEIQDRRRRALMSDIYLTGTNAVTENGTLVNLDMYGNRAGAITFGPRQVVIFAGRNKIVTALEDAMLRIKTVAAPANAIRLKMNTPCARTGICHDCSSADRICNVWSITEKSLPKGRITVVLINEDIGF